VSGPQGCKSCGRIGAESQASRSLKADALPADQDTIISQAAIEQAAQLYGEASSLAEAGSFRKAGELFARAIRLNSLDARLYEARAQCSLELDEAHEAIGPALRAVELAPGWSVSHATLGRALRNEGHLQDSSESLARAAQLAAQGDDPEFRVELEGEAKEVAALLERHWAEHHDIVLTLPAPDASSFDLRIRQHVDCCYCNLSGEKGPGGALWASGVVLARHIACLARSGFSWRGIRVLELGSGTGLAGLAAAALGAEVLMTDREEVLPVSRCNVDLNSDEVSRNAGRAACAAFDWLDDVPSCVREHVTPSAQGRASVVLAADLVYSFASVAPFADALAAVLKGSSSDSGSKRRKQQDTVDFGGLAVIRAIYAHNPRSPELDAQMRAALSERGLVVKDALVPSHDETLTEPLGAIGASALKRVLLLVITAAEGPGVQA